MSKLRSIRRSRELDECKSVEILRGSEVGHEAEPIWLYTIA
jgi:hypothetical protein